MSLLVTTVDIRGNLGCKFSKKAIVLDSKKQQQKKNTQTQSLIER